MSLTTSILSQFIDFSQHQFAFIRVFFRASNCKSNSNYVSHNVRHRLNTLHDTWIDSQLSQKCFLNPIAPLWSRPMTSETIYPSEYVLVEPSTEHAYHVGKRRCDRAYHSPSDYKISSKSDHGPSADLWCHIDFQDGGCDGAVWFRFPVSYWVTSLSWEGQDLSANKIFTTEIWKNQRSAYCR